MMTNAVDHVERIKVSCDGRSVGTLAMAGKGKIVFEYARTWLEQGFDLAPAYDLTFNHGMRGEHMTAIAGSGNPGRAQLLQLAQMYQVPDAQGIIDQVAGAVADWLVMARVNQVSQETANEIAGHLNKVWQRFK